MKKQWRKPELVILYHARPDENLLQKIYCKNPNPRNMPDQAAGSICVNRNNTVQCDTYAAS